MAERLMPGGSTQVAGEQPLQSGPIAEQPTVAGESWGSTVHHPKMETVVPFVKETDLPPVPLLTYSTD